MNRNRLWAWGAAMSLLAALSLQAQQSDSQSSSPETTSASVSSSSQTSAGTVPRLMKFNGVLRDVTGKPVTGPVDVTFALYSSDAGGDPLWFETQSVEADEQGRYTALIGVMHSEGLPMDLFTTGEARWLGVQVANEVEQKPRVLLLSVPYALKAADAETLGGLPASAYMLSPSASSAVGSMVPTASTASGQVAAGANDGKTPKKGDVSRKNAACSSVTSSGNATANSVAKFTAACNIENSAITEVSGNIGISTSAPQSRLDFGTSAPNNKIVVGTYMSGNFWSGIGMDTYTAGLRIAGDPGANGRVLDVGYYTNDPNHNWAPLMSVLPAGNVGIGTPLPQSRLDFGTSAANSKIVIGTYTAGNFWSGIGMDTYTAGLRIAGDPGASGRVLDVGYYTNDPNHYWTPLMSVLPAGNIGIATPSPQSRLDFGTSAANRMIVVGTYMSGNFWSGIGMDALTAGLRIAGDPGVYGRVLDVGYYSPDTNHNWTPLMSVLPAGNVGIGTPSPGAKLDVNGTANFSGLVTFTGGQTFPGTGTVTSVTAGAGLTASPSNPITTTGTLSLASASCSAGQAAVALPLTCSSFATLGVNSFSGTQTISTGDVSITNGNLDLPQTTGSGVGVITMAGVQFAHAFGTGSTFLGQNAGNFSMSGPGYNTAVGAYALVGNVSGSSDTAQGWNSLTANTTGSSNTAVGAASLLSNTTASYNTAVGRRALASNCSGVSGSCVGGNNTAVGYQAGVTSNIANANVTGASNTFIGYNSGPGISSSTPINNATAIGANALVSASNAMVLGDGTINVGIGTQTPTTTLQVAGGDISTTTVGSGLIVKSPDGTKCARIGIDNTGAIAVTSVTCP